VIFLPAFFVLCRFIYFPLFALPHGFNLAVAVPFQSRLFETCLSITDVSMQGVFKLGGICERASLRDSPIMPGRFSKYTSALPANFAIFRHFSW
jgi:hypothetical protein